MPNGRELTPRMGLAWVAWLKDTAADQTPADLHARSAVGGSELLARAVALRKGSSLTLFEERTNKRFTARDIDD